MQATAEQVVCSAHDNGVGIQDEHQVHVFERFYRVGKSHSRKSDGTGRGLVIVRHIALLYKTEIRLKSVPNQGTEIQLIFKSCGEKETAAVAFGRNRTA